MADRSGSIWTAMLLLGAATLAACGDSSSSPPPVQSTLGLSNTDAVHPGSEQARVQAYLDSFYTDRDILHSFETIFGERIDCIDFYSQPSVRAQLAQGESVSMALPPPPTAPDGSTVPDRPSPFDGQLDAHGRTRSCPSGSVPAHRPSATDIAAAGGLDAFLQQAASAPPPGAPGETAQLDCFTYSTAGQSYDHAAGYQYLNQQGILTFSSVWNPFVQLISGEHSVSQLWALTGSCEYDNARPPSQDPCTSSNAVQSLELGWIVGGNGYNSVQHPLLFTFITLDGYYQTGCWGYTNRGSCCAGGGDCFVQAPGAQYVPGTYLNYSTVGNVPVEMAFQVWNGSPQGYHAWYVYVNGNLIGWYPSSVYHGQMQSSAQYLQVGGEVYDSWPNGQHTETYMGSGWFDTSGYGVPQNYEWTAYHRHISYINSSAQYNDASLSYINGTGICGWDAAPYYDLTTTWAAGPNQTQWGSFGSWNKYFYYGGPGQ